MGKVACFYVVCKYGPSGWTFNDLWKLYEAEEMSPIAEYIVANSVGGHPFRQIGKWITNCVNFEENEKLHWPGTNYWSTPLELLDVRYGDCEDFSYITASMFQALGYQAYVVVGPRHLWVEVMAEDGKWYIFEACYGTVVSPSSNRPTYYEPTFYITDQGCYEGSPFDDIPEELPQSLQPDTTCDVIYDTRKVGSVQTVYGELTLQEEWLNLKKIDIYDSLNGAAFQFIGSIMTDLGHYELDFIVQGAGTHQVKARFEGNQSINFTESPSYVPSNEEVLALL